MVLMSGDIPRKNEDNFFYPCSNFHANNMDHRQLILRQD